MSEQETMVRTIQYVVEVRLLDGERILLDAGPEPEAAREEVARLHAGLSEGAFIRVGDDVVVRAHDVRSARLRAGRATDAYNEGGGQMSSYDTEQRDIAGQHVPMRAGRQGDGRPGFVDQYIGYGRRPYLETKPFWMTSEFLTLIGMVAAIGIALGTNDLLNGFEGWLLLTIVASAYIISRGLAKIGAKDPNPNHQQHGGQGY